MSRSGETRTSGASDALLGEGRAWLGGQGVGVEPGSLPRGEVVSVAGGAGSMSVVLRGQVVPVASAEAGRAWPWPGGHTPPSSQEVWPGPLAKGALENSKPPRAPVCPL